MESYIEAWIIADGGLDEERTFIGEKAESEYVDWAESVMAEDHDCSIEIFRIDHEHSPNIDCECVQYLTDHSPDYTNEA